MTTDRRRGLVDTNIVILRDLLNPADLPDEIAISAVTLAELSAGPHAVVGDDTSARAERGRRMAILQRVESATATVHDGVARGEVYTVTVQGRPVAELHRVSSQRRPAVPKGEVLALLDRQRPDATLSADMAWISEGTTEDLGEGAPR